MPDMIENVQVDTIVPQEGGGAVANGPMAQRLLASGFNVNALRTNTVLRKDEWKHMDTQVLLAAQERLVGVQDMYQRGLVYPIANGLGTTVFEFERMGELADAQISMDGVTRGKSDRLTFDIGYLPLPIIHFDFHVNTRVLNASRTSGQSLDTSTAEAAARKVGEKIEEMLFTGSSSFAYGGGTIYGLMDYASRNTYSLTANWDDSLASGTTVLADVRSMKQAAIDDRFYGPYSLYIPTNFETALDDDFKAASDKSIRARLLEVSSLERVQVADKLTNDNVILVQMTSDVIRMIEGLSVTVVEWQTEGNMVYNFKVMAIIIPQVRADKGGRCGVVHGS